MSLPNSFQDRIQTSTDVHHLHQELDTIRRIVIEETSYSRRDELCDKQRYIQDRLYELEVFN